MNTLATHYVKTLSLGIGEAAADVTLEAILFIAVRLVGSGPGGDHVEFMFVPNTIAPVGEIHHHKHWEIIIAFIENVYTALFNTDVEVGAGLGTAFGGDVGALNELSEGHAIGFFVISIKDNAGTNVVWTWASATTFAVNYNPRITNGETSQPVEIKFISKGIRTVT